MIGSGLSGSRRRSKTPYTTHGVYDGTVDERQIRQWWLRWPGALIAVWLGPSRKAVTDIDPRNGGDRHDLDGILSAKDFDTVAEWTPSGGEHYWYFCPDSAQLAKTSLAPGIDFLAGDCYCIIAPSTGYVSQPGYGPGEIPLRPLPEALRFALPTGARKGRPSRGTPATADWQARFCAILAALGVTVSPDEGDVLTTCCFHPDRAPSLHVDARRALFHCFAPGCPAHPGGGLRKLLDLAKTEHGLVLTTGTAAPAATLAPWEALDPTVAPCPICNAVSQIVGKGSTRQAGFVFRGHVFCHQPDCLDWQREQARRALGPLLTWEAIYQTVLPESDYRRWRDGLDRAGLRHHLALAQAGDMWLCLAAQHFTGAAVTTDLDAIYQAYRSAPQIPTSSGKLRRAPIRRPHTPDLSGKDRLAKVAAVVNQVAPVSEAAALGKALRVSVGARDGLRIDALWERAGLRLERGRASWDTEQQLDHLLEATATLKRERAATLAREANATIAGLRNPMHTRGETSSHASVYVSPGASTPNGTPNGTPGDARSLVRLE